MRKTNVLFALLLTTATLAAQEPIGDYNRQGDEYMESRQYGDAKIFYAQGVDKCDEHSIKQMTKIWLTDESMRPTLNYVMRLCHECLNNFATKKRDSTAMKMLIQYYTEGIGVEKNEEMANVWKTQLQQIRHPQSSETGATGKGKTKIRFFAGYSASQWAPYGLTAGIVGKTVGGYLRYRTNLVTVNPDEGLTCRAEENKDPILEGHGDHSYQYLKNQKTSIWMGTGGIVICASQAFHISVGGGYWKRDVISEFELKSMETGEKTGVVWAKRTDASYSGAVVDLDATLLLGKTFYVSLGGGAFNFKYVYANAGIGVFF